MNPGVDQRFCGFEIGRLVLDEVGYQFTPAILRDQGVIDRLVLLRKALVAHPLANTALALPGLGSPIEGRPQLQFSFDKASNCKSTPGKVGSRCRAIDDCSGCMTLLQFLA